MNREGSESPVSSDERLARFILFSGWIRSNESVRPDAFIPHPYLDLSVTRHKGLTRQELWQIGQGIADARPTTLYGRADIRAREVRRQSLDVEPKPVAENPNHANVSGWPTDKPAQKIIAQELAANANFVPRPRAAQS